MRTRRNRRRAWPLAMAWTFAGALALSLVQPSAAAAQSKCMPYISGGPNRPLSGTLTGYRLVTITFGADAGLEGRVFSAGLNGSITESFYVGIYDTGEPLPTQVRCDDYTEWRLQ